MTDGENIFDNNEDEDIIREMSDIKTIMRENIKNIRYRMPLILYNAHPSKIFENLLSIIEFNNVNNICCYVHKNSTREVNS